VLAPPNVSLNFPRFVDPKVDAAITTALGSTDEAVRDQAYQSVSKEFATNLPYIWLGRPVWMLAANPKVNGIAEAKNGSVQTIGAKTWLAELWIG
jgi:ABC-type transport system substrate-binding protein